MSTGCPPFLEFQEFLVFPWNLISFLEFLEIPGISVLLKKIPGIPYLLSKIAKYSRQCNFFLLAALASSYSYVHIFIILI